MSIDSIDCIRSPNVAQTQTIRYQCDSWTNTCVANKMFDCIHAIDNILLLVPSALSPCNNFLTKQCKQQHATKCSHIMWIPAIASLQVGTKTIIWEISISQLWFIMTTIWTILNYHKQGHNSERWWSISVILVNIWKTGGGFV